MSTRRTGLAAVAAVALLLAGCGVGTDDAPRTLTAADQGVLESTSTTTTTLPDNTVEMEVFLVDATDRLTAVTREVPAPVSVERLIRSLLGPVTPAETAQNLATAIPPGTELIEAERLGDDGLVRLDLSEELYLVQGDGLTRALAQLVWTATNQELAPRVTRVQIAVDGEVRDVQDSEGATKREVTRADYLNLGPRP